MRINSDLLSSTLAIVDSRPSAPRLRFELEEWIESLLSKTTSGVKPAGSLIGSRPSANGNGDEWEIHFRAVTISTPAESANGATVEPVKYIADGNIITRASAKKAEDYSQPHIPYIGCPVATRHLCRAICHPSSTYSGPERWLWGNSRDRDEYHHRLYDPATGEEIFHEILERRQFPVPEWYVVHNPFADKPLPQGLFSFALEYASEMGRMVKVEPTCTVNEILGLPDPWPGEEH